MRLHSLATSLLVLATASACAQTAGVQSATGSAKVTTASGIVFESLVAGSGPAPSASDTVRVHYRGTFPDGREFDSSHKRGQPAEFPLNRVIPCWTEGVQMMRPGGKAKLVCPPATAYGERGAGAAVPPNATLHFEIELISVSKR
ncbi:MAG: FKBP-type peptidyl-prolyl cis-trans isomerase [Ramlibacter sp.]